MARGLTINEKKIIDGVTIAQYYNDYIHPLDAKYRMMVGDRPTSLCPFHVDTDPSFHDWRTKKLFKCFGCGSAGTVIQLHQMISTKYHKINLSKEDAMEQLATIYGIELEKDERGDIKAESPFDIARQKLLNPNQYAVNPKDMSKMTIAGFRHFNNQVKNNKNLPEPKKGQSYHRLDIMLSAYLMNQKDQSDTGDNVDV